MEGIFPDYNALMEALPALVVGLTHILKKAFLQDEELQDRFGGLVAVGLGLALGLITGGYYGQDILIAGYTGLKAGLIAVGLYTAVKRVAGM